MSNEKAERRFLTKDNKVEVEMRSEGNGNGTLKGYAAVFNKPADEGLGFREIIEPGAFDDSLKNKADVRALVDHESGKIIGRTKAGTLRLKTDKKGLFAEIDLPDTSVGRDIRESVSRGDIDGMSFQFITVSDRWEKKDKEQTRYIEKVELIDVAPVTFPAYPDTSVALRSLDKWDKNNPESSIKNLRLRLKLAE